MVWRDLGRVGVTPSDRIPAVHPLAKGEDRSGRTDLGPIQRLCTKHRTEHLELRQIEPCVAGEQPRPRATCQDRRLTSDPASFGYHPGKLAPGSLDATHGGVGEDLGAVIASGLGDGGAARAGSARPSRRRVESRP